MKDEEFFVHSTSTVDSGAKIGKGTKVWHYTHICSGAEIGTDCVLGQNVYVGPGVKIGNNVKIQNNVSIYKGVEVEDHVFLGPSCVLTNDKYPSADGEWSLVKTLLKEGSSVGANATIICGVTLGEGSLVGAGAVVTKDVRPGATVVGNPAKEMGAEMRSKIGVIGCGTVGGAIVSALKKTDKFELLMSDKYKHGSEYLKVKALKDCDLVFISVPTPFDEEMNSVNLEPVLSASTKLSNAGFTGILVIKSTIPTGTARKIQEKSPNLKVVFNPEFLREKTAVEDFYNQKNVIFGVPDSWDIDDQDLLEMVFNSIIKDFRAGTIQYTSYEVAEMIKYAQNVMFASRVAICNVIFDACQDFKIDYDKVKELAFYNEPTIGSSVVEVPGPDGLRGFGGKCLPKDLAGFNGSIHKNEILDAILKYNKKLGRKIE